MLVPLRATTAVLPLVELLLIEICPVAAPVAVGSNRTCRVVAWGRAEGHGEASADDGEAGA